jgi:hypothetical protein
MTMKKVVICAVVMIIFFGVSTVSASDSRFMDNPVYVEVNENAEKSSENIGEMLELRIEEIRDMDKSDLTVEEREELKKELRDILDQARQPGVYISFSALIVILLLILIFR